MDGTTWTRHTAQGLVGTPVQFPDPADNSTTARYSVTCVAPTVPCSAPRLFGLNDNVECPSFCSFNELKLWVESRYTSEVTRTTKLKIAGIGARIRPLIYDLKYAVDLIDNTVVNIPGVPPSDDDPYFLQDTLPSLINIVNGSVYRMDMCQCENTLRCPNGTTTASIGAKSVYDCVREVDEVRGLPL